MDKYISKSFQKQNQITKGMQHLNMSRNNGLKRKSTQQVIIFLSDLLTRGLYNGGLSNTAQSTVRA